MRCRERRTPCVRLGQCADLSPRVAIWHAQFANAVQITPSGTIGQNMSGNPGFFFGAGGPAVRAPARTNRPSLRVTEILRIGFFEGLMIRLISVGNRPGVSFRVLATCWRSRNRLPGRSRRCRPPVPSRITAFSANQPGTPCRRVGPFGL